MLVNKYNEEKNKINSRPKEIIPGNNFGNIVNDSVNSDVTIEVPESEKFKVSEMYDDKKIKKDFAEFTRTSTEYAADIHKAITKVLYKAPCDYNDISGSELVEYNGNLVTKRDVIVNKLEEAGYKDLADIVLNDPQIYVDITIMKRGINDLKTKISANEAFKEEFTQNRPIINRNMTEVVKEFVAFSNATDNEFGPEIYSSITRTLSGAPCNDDTSNSDFTYYDNKVVTRREVIVRETDKTGYNNLANIVINDPQLDHDLAKMKKDLEDLQMKARMNEEFPNRIGQTRLMNKVNKDSAATQENNPSDYKPLTEISETTEDPYSTDILTQKPKTF